MYYYVYILANKKHGVLYVGITNNIIKRVYEHKNNIADGFTREFNVHRLVYFESTTDVKNAILREKRLKKWKRQWKIRLIEKNNPDWNDLYESIV